MKAIVYEKGAAPGNLVLRDVEKSIPGDHEVLVKIQAASVNAADTRSMKMGLIPKRKIFGADIAGVVEAAGKNTDRFEIGDEVFGDISEWGFGGFAEYVAVPVVALVMKPAAVSFEKAAAVPMAAVTALQGLRNEGAIQSGQHVLIVGAGGGVGTFAVQLAKVFGASVTAVCGAKNVQLMQDLGADEVINYQQSDLARIEKRFDLVLAVNGNYPLSTYRRLLTARGICVVIGGSLSQVLKTMLFGKLLSLGRQKVRLLKAKPDAKDLEFVIKLIEEGKLTPVIDRVFPLADTAEAMRYMGEGHAQGKVIIQVAE